MIDPLVIRRTGYRALFVALAAMIVFVKILPFHVGQARLPAPDLISVLAFAWVLRRPEYVPVLLVAGTALLADILFMQPLGLWPLLLVLATEGLRGRTQPYQRANFLAEWLMVAVALAAMALVTAVIHALFVIPQPPASQLAGQLAASVAAYPFAVLVSTWGLGVRPPDPSDAEEIRL